MDTETLKLNAAAQGFKSVIDDTVTKYVNLSIHFAVVVAEREDLKKQVAELKATSLLNATETK